MNKVLLFVATFLLMGCNKKTTEKTMNADVPFDYKVLAKTKLDGKLVYVPNEDGQLILCHHMAKPGERMRFLVIDLTKQQIIYEQSVGLGGQIGWYNDYQLKVVDPPGVSRRDETPKDYVYYLNLLTKKKTKGEKF